MTDRIRTIVVVGRDVALWLTASVLRMALRPACVDVEAVELPSGLSPADCCATLPQLEALHQQLRLQESTLIRTTRGAFSLGQNFTSNPATSAFLHAYGAAGTGIDGTDFFGHWLKARRFGLSAGLDDFSLAAAAARHGRLFIPDDDSDLYASNEYGYHLPALAYAGLLKSIAVAAGVHVHQTCAAEPVLAADRSRIEAVELDTEQLVAGELFVDAGGPGGCLMGVLGIGQQSWRDSFAGDRLLTALAPKLSPTPVYAEVRATDHGWTGLFPTQERTHILHAFASAECSDEQALQDAVAGSDTPLSDVRIQPLEQGILKRLWSANCVAVGPAACVFDPLHGVDLHAVQLGLVHLLSCLPASLDMDAQAKEYDRLTRSAFEKLRDFQSAHYVLNNYHGSYWQQARHGAPSSNLTHRVATFSACGEIAPWEDDSFQPDSWRTLFLGHGVHPDTYPPAVDRTDPDQLKGELRRMLGFVKGHVLRQPVHSAYLDRIARGDHA